MLTVDFILASNRPENLERWLSHHAPFTRATAYVVVDDDKMKEICDRYEGVVPIKNLRPGKSFYELHHSYNEAFFQGKGEFVTNVNDEILWPKNWRELLDQELPKYLEKYPDKIFRLKPTRFRNHSYSDLWECLLRPENYAIFTRSWLNAVGGFGTYWGTDSFQQCIDLFLNSTIDKHFPFGLYRSFPLEFFPCENTAAGEGYEGEKGQERHRRIIESWEALSTIPSQKNFLKLSLRLRHRILESLLGLPLRFSIEGDDVVLSTGQSEVLRYSLNIPSLQMVIMEGLREKTGFKHHCH